MKSFKLLSALLILFLTNSCTVDDDVIVDPTILGRWNLVQVSGTIAGTTYNFNYGDVTWDFALQSFIVTNNNLNENLIGTFESGTYSYQVSNVAVEAFSCVQTISFFADDVNCLQFDKNTLYISQNIADGITLKFIR